MEEFFPKFGNGDITMSEISSTDFVKKTEELMTISNDEVHIIFKGGYLFLYQRSDRGGITSIGYTKM